MSSSSKIHVSQIFKQQNMPLKWSKRYNFSHVNKQYLYKYVQNYNLRHFLPVQFML